jgi:hypothetical protein
MFIGPVADHRLKQRRGQLEGQGDHPDLHEGQGKLRLKQRVNRQNQRLDHIVQQMGQADCAQNTKRGACFLRRSSGAG